jgi:hypothetical protein
MTALCGLDAVTEACGLALDEQVVSSGWEANLLHNLAQA